MSCKEKAGCLGGFLLFGTGCFLAFTWANILQILINNEMVLSPTSRIYEPWMKAEEGVYIKFYFWNWTNPEGIKLHGYKPHFQEMGPYTYREVSEKVNVIWNLNGTVTYQRRRIWHFCPDKSVGSEDDPITTLNIISTVVAHLTRHSNPMVRMAINLGLSSTQKVEVTKSVVQLLFEGYHNILQPFERFGWFYKRNGSADPDGVFNIETGLNGMDTFGKIRMWNYNNHTHFFKNECGAVSGSGGELYPPNRTKNDIIEMFSPDLCRYMPFTFAREIVVNDISAVMYEPPLSVFDNGRENRENECFCGGECAPPGVLNVTSCRYGAPVFVSYPHFYLADPGYRDNILGMQPTPESHGMHITLEPTYGVVLNVVARFQINMLVQPHRDLALYRGLKPVYFPLLWFEQAVATPDVAINVVKILLKLPVIGLAVAVLFILSGASLMTIITWRKYNGKRTLFTNKMELTKVFEPLIKKCNGGAGNVIA